MEGFLKRVDAGSGFAKRHLNDPASVVAIGIFPIEPNRPINCTLGLRKHQNTSIGDGQLIEAVRAVSIQSRRFQILEEGQVILPVLEKHVALKHQPLGLQPVLLRDFNRGDPGSAGTGSSCKQDESGDELQPHQKASLA